MKYFFLCIVFLLVVGCQRSASSNRDLSTCDTNIALAYPLQTGQQNVFAYENIATQPSTFYYDDGFYKMGYKREFVKEANGTVTNKNYNLQWQDNEAIKEHNLTRAEDYCTNLTVGGYNDWRLPNVYELLTLMDLSSMGTVVEKSFENMPSGLYYSSNKLQSSKKVYAVGFENSDFYIKKIDQVYDANQSSEAYGTLVGVEQIPKYSSKGELLYISEATIYYKETDNLLTTITFYKRFDANGTITSIDGPFVVQETPLHPPEVKPIEQAYVKCVRGKEIGGFSLERDREKEIVTDSITGLVWQDNTDVVNYKHQWGEAEQYCSELFLGGYQDWRLPTISELITIVDFNNSAGTYAVNKAFLYKSANKFHSSSNLCYGENCQQSNLQLNACGYLDKLVIENREVDMNPYDNNESEPYYKVRCVRCGGYSQ